MKTRILSWLIVLALACNVAWSATEKMEPMEAINDISPTIGPLATYPTMDTMWDMLYWFNAQGALSNQLLLGAACEGGYFWVTGGGSSSAVTSDNLIYRLTSAGVAVDSFPQPDVGSGWGFRDIAWDGSYFYAGCEGPQGYAWDLTGAMVPAMNITKPAGSAVMRALAYDPITDSFWTGNFGSALFNFTRTGSIIWTGPSSPLTAVYGMAWDDQDPAGPWLWIYDQGGSGTVFYQFNPTTHTFTGVSYSQPLFGGLTANIAGGCEFSDNYNPAFWTMVALGQGTAFDNVFVLEMYLALSQSAPSAPTGFTVSNNGMALNATLNWTNPTTMINGNPLTTINSVEIKRNGNPLTSLVGTPGQVMSYMDAVPSVGNYNYQVYCVNDSGNGQPANAGGWIGLDTPDAPTNVNAVGGWLTATITWTAPTAGEHGGYFPPGSWDGQKVYRGGTLIATLIGTNTQYVDNPPTQGTYTYGVAYYNSSGDGPTANASPCQVQGPEQYVATSIPYNWVEINPAYPGALPGINTGLSSDDQNLGPFPIGFDFTFYDGMVFNSVRMCTNGWASFTSTATTYTNVAIPNTAEPNNLLAPYWDDLYMTSGYSNGAYYYTDLPNDRFIMEWDSVSHFSTTAEKFTFEIILYTDGTLDYMYKFINLVTYTPSATVGVENATGTVGAQATYNGSGPIEPVSMSGIHFGPTITTADITVTLVPIVYPIQIPATGGSFSFYAFISNNETFTVPTTLWTEQILPDSSTMGPILGPASTALPPGVRGYFRTQDVPGTALPGLYTYIGNAGIYPSQVWGSDQFTYTKLTTGNGPWIGDWNNFGDPIGDEMIGVAALPAEYLVKAAYPNPFNPTTTIGFTLPSVCRVTLSVYDISGRQVATLVDGWREAGNHEVVFDGSTLASGIYLYRLSADNWSTVGKMVLMK